MLNPIKKILENLKLKPLKKKESDEGDACLRKKMINIKHFPIFLNYFFIFTFLLILNLINNFKLREKCIIK